MSKLSERLKELRHLNNLTQRELAEYLGISIASYSLYELGKRELNFMILEKLAKYYHTTTDDLLGINNQVDAIAAHFDGDEYTPEELEEIRQFAEFVKSKRRDAADRLQVNAAHERTDVGIPEGADTSDDDIMNDDNF